VSAAAELAAGAPELDPGIVRPIVLRDGAELEVRPIDAGDVGRLRRLFDRLSPTSVYFRFFAPIRRPRPGALEHLASVDHDRREALVAVVDDEIVAVARYDSGAGADEAELAITVEDAWQRRGLGVRLSRRLAELARTRGYIAFTASVLGENRGALALMRAITPNVDVRFRSGQYDVYVPLRAATEARSRVR
jgi:GNAT superfamily N-acetyltransferase